MHCLYKYKNETTLLRFYKNSKKENLRKFNLIKKIMIDW